jgi:hypothetical protein
MNVIARERVVPNKETGENVVKKNDGPLIYSCGIKVFEKVLKFMVDEEYGNLSDLKSGYDFQIRKEKQGDWPNYDDSKSMKNPSEAGTKEEIERWMSELHDLSTLIRHESYEELKLQLDIYRGVVSDPFSTEQKTEETESKTTQPSPSVSIESSIESESSGDQDFFQELQKLRLNS